jgi:hypothetical protein
MSEPNFLRQARIDTQQTKMEWLGNAVAAAREAGMTWARVSQYPDDDKLFLYEAWKERPDDEGPPRFQFLAPVSERA